MLLFMLLFVGSFTTSNAYTTVNSAIQLSPDEMTQVVVSIHADNKFSGDVISGITETFNRWSRLYAQIEGFSAQNILFFRPQYQDRIGWTLVNGTAGTFPYGYLNSDNRYDSIINNQAYSYIYLAAFTNWTLNNSGEPTGTVRGNLAYWYISLSAPATYNQVSGVVQAYNYDSNNQTMQVTVGPSTGGSAYAIYVPGLVALSQTHVIYANTQLYGRNSYFLSNYLSLHNSGEAPPAPTPTPGGGGGDSPGGGSLDLTETNGKIDDVKEEVTQQGEAIVNQLSGDKAEIIESQQQSTEAITGSIDDAFDPDTSKIDSGDIDLSINDFEIDEQTDPTSNFFTWLLEQIQDILTTDGDETLEFDFLDEHYILNSSDFSGPEGALKTFLVAYFTFAVGFLTALDIRKIIEQFKNGNIEAIASDDINANIV